MRLNEFREKVRVYIQHAQENQTKVDETGAPEVPIELTLLWRIERYGMPYLAGGLADQPHILLMCFDIILNERARFQQLLEMNRRIQQEWEEKQERGSSAR